MLAIGVGTPLRAQVGAWAGVDIGSPTHAGSVTDNHNGSFTISGGGADIWGTADQCFYFYTSVTGVVWDARMQIISLDGPDTWSKAELMARRFDPSVGTPQAGDPQLDACATRTAGQNDIEFQYRGTRNGSSGNQAAVGLTPQYPNQWLRITRFQSTFNLYYSTNGTTWNLFNSQDTATTANGFDGTPWENPIGVGVAITAHNDSTTNLAITVVSNLTVTVTPVVPPTIVGISNQISGTTNVFQYTEASFNFVATNNATPAGIYGMSYAWYKNNVLVSTNGMGPNYTFLTTPEDNNAQIYAVGYVTDTNYSSLTVTSAVLTLTANAGATIFTNGLKRELFANATRPQVEIGSVAAAGRVDMVTAADIGTVNFNGTVNYVERLSGWFIPPADGNYVFFINSDDTSDLFLSTNDISTNMVLIAQETGYAGAYQWHTTSTSGTASQKRSDTWSPDGGTTMPWSAGIPLLAGQRYYIQAVHEQDGGGADLNITYATTNQTLDPSFATTFTNGTLPLINATNNNIALITVAGTNLVWVAQPQASITLYEGATTNLTALASSDAEMALHYQWFINDALYPGANGTNLVLSSIPANYNGARFYCVANTEEGGLVITSTVCTLTVHQAVFEAGFLKNERWSNQTSVAPLESGSLGSPDWTMAVPEFGVTVNNPTMVNNFVRRVSGYFIPPATTNYVFYTTSDDDSDLFLSTDNTPANKRLICHQDYWDTAAPWGWQTYPGWVTWYNPANLTRSSTYLSGGTNGILLTQGQRYYIEQDFHQGGGGACNAATFVMIPDGAPAPATYDPASGMETRFKGNIIGMSAIRCSYVNFTQQPTSVTSAPMSYATFSAAGASDSTVNIGNIYDPEDNQTNNLFFQWYTNGAPVPGANLAKFSVGPLLPGHNGMQVMCKMRALGYADNSLNPIWTNSQIATITV
ncbi:MAG TPA: hypothetical protein VF988_02595, partial [Verrucomicrobiae bacterium]